MKTNRYQQRTASLQEVTDRIDIGDPAKVSRVILSVSPCRSGTTVMLRVFGATGIESHYQELKNVLRWRLQGGDVKWQLPQRPGETVYLKETLGPYTETEALFNPLDVLLRAGFPPEKLQVLIVGRAPLSTWASWDAWWHGKTTIERFILAYQTTEQIRQQALQHGLPVTVWVYETIRNNGAKTVVRNLFRRLGVPFAPVAVKGWRALPPFGSPDSNVVLPEEPPIFFVQNLHASIEKADKLAFFSRTKSIPNLRQTEVSGIGEAGIPKIYEVWRRACEKNLGISVERDQTWEQYEAKRFPRQVWKRTRRQIDRPHMPALFR
jgi:hypothetical protein